MNTALEVRRLAQDEFAMLRAIRLEALSVEPKLFASSLSQFADLLEAGWRNHLSEPVFVAFESGVPIGMMALQMRRPVKMAHRAHLTSVYIRPAFRGMGIAGMLLSTVVAAASSAGIRQIELGVRSDNLGALRFYTRNGFEIVGRVPDGFVDGCGAADEVLMMLRLPFAQDG